MCIICMVLVLGPVQSCARLRPLDRPQSFNLFIIINLGKGTVVYGLHGKVFGLTERSRFKQNIFVLEY